VPIAIDIDQLRSGNRRALAKAITQAESSLSSHRESSQALLQAALLCNENRSSIRIGISGTPGVGKSTFIEALGMLLVGLDKKLAVLAVDPSSPVAGGSILGDKTRMELLSREKNAFIRPSPSGGQLGGVAHKTRESMLLCEAAGFDVIIVETVGVGQSEFEVSDMVDFFLVLMQPNGGDELQGIKKGILELADALVINKADGQGKFFADQARQHYENAIRLVGAHRSWPTRVMSCSSIENRNIDAVWSMLKEFISESETTQLISRKRTEQNRAWMQKLFYEFLEIELADLSDFQRIRGELDQQVAMGQITPFTAATNLIKRLKLGR